MMDVLLLRFNVNVIHLRNISDFCGQLSEQKLCERVRQRGPEPMSTTDVWRGITFC